MGDRIKPADYPLEKYAKALEALAKEPGCDPEIASNEDPFEYAEIVATCRTFRRGLKAGFERAAAMLRMTPMGLYTVYPDYFPNPNEEANDDRECEADDAP